jgi:hypothetical protein
MTLNGELTAVDVDPGSVWKAAAPRRLFTGLPPASWSWHPSGDRFLIPQAPSTAGPPPPFTIVLNWLQRLEP